jgi:hypothetical protein
VTSIADGKDAEFRKLLDRFGVLDTRYREAKPMIKERETLKKLIESRYESKPGAEAIRATGNLYYVDLGARDHERRITHQFKAFTALKKAMGITQLIGALKFTMKLIDAHVPTEQQSGFVVTERTGPREVSAVLIKAPEAA